MRSLKKKLLPYFLMSPTILLLIVVSFFPLLYAIRESMYETKYLQLVNFIFLDHYREIFSTEAGWKAIINSWTHVFGTVLLAMPTGLLIASLLNREFRLPFVRTVFRSILILPYTISWLIASFLWMWMLNSYYGLITYALRTFLNFTLPDFTKSGTFAMPVLIQATSWRLYPLATLFILASLQTIPLELHEAARIDGASSWKILRYITFPLIKNTVLVVMVLITLETFNMVTMTLTLTGGGPGEATTTLAYKAFREGFQFWHLGYASALAVVIFIFNIGLSFVYTRLLKTERYY